MVPYKLANSWSLLATKGALDAQDVNKVKKEDDLSASHALHLPIQSTNPTKRE